MTLPAGLSGEALGPEERELLAQPSVQRVVSMLQSRCRLPLPWVQAAVVTLHRFGEQVAGGELGDLLDRGLVDVEVAADSLRRLDARHQDRSPAYRAAASFGPKLWWRMSGVPVAWRAPSAGGRPGDPPAELDARICRLALLGTGMSRAELRSLRVADAGSLDAGGRLIPDLAAEPLALEYRAEDRAEEREGPGDRLVSFLPFDARAALLGRLRARAAQPGDPLLLL